MNEIRDFKGIWIPKEIWLNKDLTIQEKILLIEINSLDNSKGCYAQNGHFVQLLGVGERRIQKLIKSLVDKNYIKSTFKYKKGTKLIESRSLKINKKKYYGIEDDMVNESSVGGEQKVAVGGEQKVAVGGERKFADKNNTINNTINNTFIYSRVISYLNEKTNKSFKATTKKTKSLIDARLHEKFTLEDFIKVIDNKVSEWTGTNFEIYLRPETLFGNKFEGYLQGGKCNGGITKDSIEEKYKDYDFDKSTGKGAKGFVPSPESANY